MARLLSRAYERLNNVLQLAGNTAIQDIDIESAFATHDLGTIVQGARAGRWLYNVEDTAAGAATQLRNLDPLDPTDWDVIVTPENQVLTTFDADDLPNATDDDIWIVHVGINSDGTLSVARVFFESDVSTSATMQWPLTQNLDDIMDTVGGQDTLVNANGPYYAVPMPYKVQNRVIQRARLTYTGAGTAGIFVHILAAPKGVLPQWV